MNELTLQIKSGTLPTGFCPTDFQALVDGAASIYTATFPTSFKGITYSSSVPTDTTQGWFQLDSSGRPVRLYAFSNGKWLSQHSLVPGHIMIWVGPLPDFTTFDGGDSSTLGVQSGPMWQQAQDASGNPVLVGQFPLGIGNIPIPSTTKILPNQAGGEENHVLLLGELAPHSHTFHDDNLNTDSANLSIAKNVTGGGGGFNGLSFGGCTRTAIGGGDPNSGTPPITALGHNNMPPFYAVAFLQRTGRLFYSV